MAVKSKTLWTVLVAEGCAAVLPSFPWGCVPAENGGEEMHAEAHFNQGVAHAEKGDLDAANGRAQGLEDRVRVSLPLAAEVRIGVGIDALRWSRGEKLTRRWREGAP